MYALYIKKKVRISADGGSIDLITRVQRVSISEIIEKVAAVLLNDLRRRGAELISRLIFLCVASL